jgi:signal transduction histidine kinase
MEALGALTGGIAHDFNNILAAMMGFTEMVRDHMARDSRYKHYLDRVMEAGLRGRELIRQMLTFIRKTEQEKKPLKLSGIVKETVKFLRASTPSTINIKVDVRSESGLILGDPVQIQRVLMNLCSNAAFAMRERGGVLDIGLSEFALSPSNGDSQGIEAGAYMRLMARDTGSGIAPEIIDRVFDPFFTTKELGEATGLGLSVVHGIVNQAGGSVTVESEPGKGSTFTVYFPKIAEGSVPAAVSHEALPTG